MKKKPDQLPKKSSKLKRVCLDFIGYSLILLAVLLGWLPGPGGTPLLLAGLAILSINNSWAQRFRDYLEHHGKKLLDQLFPDDKQISHIWDGVNLVALVSGLVVFSLWQDNVLAVMFTSGSLAASVIIWARNKRRFRRYSAIFRKHFRR